MYRGNAERGLCMEGKDVSNHEHPVDPVAGWDVWRSVRMGCYCQGEGWVMVHVRMVVWGCSDALMRFWASWSYDGVTQIPMEVPSSCFILGAEVGLWVMW